MEERLDSATEKQLVDDILDEALAEFEGLLTPELMREVRGCLEDRLRAHPEQRMLLRRALADPRLDQSGEVDTVAEEQPDERAPAGQGTR